MDFDTAIDILLDTAALDYATWRENMGHSHKESFDSFRPNIYVGGGRKYLRIVSEHSGQRSVWGFVVMKDGGKFRKGDILKAASWAAPATNKARGNIFDDDYEVNWTGPLYL